MRAPCVIPVAVARTHACAARLHAHAHAYRTTAVQRRAVQPATTTAMHYRAMLARRVAPRRGESTHGFITDGRQGVRGWRHARSLARCDLRISILPLSHTQRSSVKQASTSSLPRTNHCTSLLLPGLGPAVKRGQGAASWRLLRAS